MPLSRSGRGVAFAAALTLSLPPSGVIGTLSEPSHECTATPWLCDRREHYHGAAALEPLDLPMPASERLSDGPVERTSSLKFSTQYGMNVGIARNGCLDLEGVLRLFEPPRPARDDATDAWEAVAGDWGERLSQQGQYGFKYGWRIELFPDELEGSGIRWNQGFAVVARPAYGRNIHHFAESVIFLFHAALHPEVYPWFRRVDVLLLPTVARSSELGWSLEFLDLVLRAAAHHGAQVPNVLFREDLLALGVGRAGTDALACYERVGLLGMTTSEFGLFADPYEAELFRHFAYRHFNLTEEGRGEQGAGAGAGRSGEGSAASALRKGPNDRAAGFLAARKHTRRLVNLEQVRAAILDTGLVDLDDFLPTPLREFEDQPLRTHVAWMKASDILIGVHGSGIINSMFMERGSVVIDLLCPHFIELTFTPAVLSAGHHYLFLPNTNTSSGSGYPSGGSGGHPSGVPPHCFEGSPYGSSSMDCLAIRNCDLEADLHGVELLVRQADILVRQFKRRLTRGGHTDNGRWQRGRRPDRTLEPLDLT